MASRHDRLFDDYVQELRKAKGAAETWWKKLIVAEMRKGGSREEAVSRIKRRWPMGPASHPYVVAVLRKYWLACEKLEQEIIAGKRETDDEAPIPPSAFLCESLLDGKHTKLAVFISPLNYWPIGNYEDDEVKD
jgi:hypothetical protein